MAQHTPSSVTVGKPVASPLASQSGQAAHWSFCTQTTLQTPRAGLWPLAVRSAGRFFLSLVGSDSTSSTQMATSLLFGQRRSEGE